MSTYYEGMTGTITLGADRMSKAVRKELNLPPRCTAIDLYASEARVTLRDGQYRILPLSPLALIPTLTRTPARRARYEVKAWHA